MNNNVLIVAAHPDDEVLGCGGVAARHARRGDLVEVLIVGEGATSRGDGEDTISALVDAARNAAEILGTRPPHFGGLPDNSLDTVALLDVVKLVEEISEKVRPDVVYTHHAGDLNIDHQVVARAVATAFRPLPNATAKALYSFETVSSTDWAVPHAASHFEPCRFENISDVLDLKLAALECYKSEMRAFPHARSVDAVTALARVRGATSGVDAAEAFGVLREVIV